MQPSASSIRRSSLYIVLVLAYLTVTSCATIFSPGPDPVSFSSDPDGATVLVNGVSMGETPVTLELETNKEMQVTFRREGYKDITVALTTHVQPGWVVLDILAGLVGVAVDAATGEWKAFDSGEQYVVLEPVN